MNMRKKIMLLAYCFVLSHIASSQKVRSDYLGQKPPGNEPEIFAPGYISMPEQYEFGSVFSQSGDAFYYGVDVGGRSEIRFSRLVDGTWSRPEVLLSHDVYGYNDPMLSPSEDRLYFISDMPLEIEGDKSIE